MVSSTPKAGMVYQATPSLNLKALFGSAFRLLSFLESVDSNPDQDTTEELRTFEIGVSYQPLDWLLTEMNYFYTDINELIQVAEGEDTGAYPIETTRIYQNIGGIDVHGVEFELSKCKGDWIGNYSQNYAHLFSPELFVIAMLAMRKPMKKSPILLVIKPIWASDSSFSAEKRSDEGVNTLGIFRAPF